MKTLQQYLAESSKDTMLKKLQKTWDDYNSELPIDMQELIGFAKRALESEGIKPRDILREIERYNDPDDFEDAMEKDILNNVRAFLDELADIMADSDYEGNEGDYADNVGVPTFLWDFMNYMAHYEK